MRELDRLKLYRARSRLYRSQILQVNTRWKALDEIYNIYMPLHRSDLNTSAKCRHRSKHLSKHFGAFNIRNAKKFKIFKLVLIFADLHEICSDSLRFSRKTLQLLEVSRFQFNFSTSEIHLIFFRAKLQ